jgi:transposase
VPALPSSIVEPLWVQVAALLPTCHDTHPLGCHRPRVPDRVVFDKLIQVLVFGCGYRRIADHSCSATTLRRRRDEWISAGVAEQLRLAVLAAYDRMIGLSLEHLAVDGCATKAPCGGQTAGPSPVDRRKQGLKRSVAVEAGGIPLPGGTSTASCAGAPSGAGSWWSSGWRWPAPSSSVAGWSAAPGPTTAGKAALAAAHDARGRNL